MPLGQVFIQNLAHFFKKLTVNIPKPLGYILMYGRN